MAKEKHFLKIEVHTLPNGYSLDVDGTGYMYYNEIDLIAGFMAHVGLSETNYMDRGSIMSALMSAMIGDAYSDAVTTLKQRVGLLTTQYTNTIERMDKAIDYVTQAEKQIDSMLGRVKALEEQIKGTEQIHIDNKKIVEDTKVKLASIEKKADKVMDSLANSATIMRAMEEANDAIQQKANEGQKDPDKSGDVDGKSAEPAADNKRKGKGGRNKAADAKIVKEIEKKAKENPNIK
jgi:cysteinyl-tRNA synthetase